jgi:4-aminobutyrate aminotransferase-like enzyme
MSSRGIELPPVRDLPGPRSRALLERLRGKVWSGLGYETMPFVLKRKHGSLLEDVDGNVFIDMVTGWGSTNVGATQPRVVEATVATLRDIGIEISDYIASEPVVSLAERLVEIAPSRLSRVSFEISGTEAVETAVKFMRHHSERPLILTFTGQYHGESAVALGAGSQEPEGSRWVREFVPGFVHVPYPYPYRCPFRHGAAGCDGLCVIRYIEDQVLRYLTPPDRIAGVLIEPVAGEAGVIVPPAPFWQGLNELCERHGWLLCADEVQTGFGRTGELFAVEHWGVQPDLMTLAKGMSGGAMPIGATLGSEAVMGDLDAFAGGTYAWTPAACSAALAGIEVLTEGDLVARAGKLGDRLREELADLPERYPFVGDVRVIGLLMAVEFVKDKETKAPAVDVARAVHHECLRRGVADIYDDGMWLLRWQPALTITEAQLDTAVAVLRRALDAVADR